MTLALAFAAPAAAEAPLVKGSFEGQPFEYSSRLGAKDAILIEGRFVRGEQFRFTVKPGGRVNGEVGSRAVSFTVSKAEWEKLARSVSARTQVADAGGASFSVGTN
jgi:hypothetical protein